MINFRFHLASLIAIFLALALGVVIGAGVIDRGVVDALDNRLNRVEANANRIQDENDALRDELSEKDGVIESLGNQTVTGKLSNADVGLVAVRGVDGDRVEQTATSLRAAGATVTGVLWLESPWALDDDDEVTSLANVIGSSARRPTTLRTQAWEQIGTRLGQSPLTVAAGGDDLLRELDDAGFVSFEAPSTGGDLTQFPGVAASMVLIVGTDADVPTDDVVMPASTAIAGERLALVAADLYAADAPDAGSRGSAFAELRNSALSTVVSTVDDLDRPQGPLTVTLALSALLRIPPDVGHYGLGTDTVLLPEPVAS